MDESQLETATIGGGCFWCLEAVFEELEGVASVQSGYSGGARANPSYEQVCSGATGHAEVTQLNFDPSVTSFHEILQVFFATHDPTTLNQQGADRGTQYRSVIFYHSEAQKQTAEGMIDGIDKAGVLENPVVTEVSPLDEFYPAEEYHRSYYKSNPDQQYCQFVVSPKLSKFRMQFFDKVKQQPE
jgi:peptide-methionine (S)-S-oxide reductase